MNFKIRHHWKNSKGFTLIELSVSLVILTMLALFSGRLYLNYTDTSRDLKAANLVQEEARFLMERIVREVRQNSIDYEEYFNQNIVGGNYGENYCAYNSFFYDSGPDNDPATWGDNDSTGLRNPEMEVFYALASHEAVRPIENELYLINVAGDERTVLTRVEKDAGGVDIGKMAMLQMVGKDLGVDGIDSQDSYIGQLAHNDFCDQDDREGDGLVDTWHCAPGFPCKIDEPIAGTGGCDGYTHLLVNNPADVNHSFIDLSPSAINIVDLRFMVTPTDDPWKAYNIDSIQIQPHVTIQFTAEANPYMINLGNGDRVPSITLTSTVTARNYDEISSDCR